MKTVLIGVASLSTVVAAGWAATRTVSERAEAATASAAGGMRITLVAPPAPAPVIGPKLETLAADTPSAPLDQAIPARAPPVHDDIAAWDQVEEAESWGPRLAEALNDRWDYLADDRRGEEARAYDGGFAPIYPPARWW